MSPRINRSKKEWYQKRFQNKTKFCTSSHVNCCFTCSQCATSIMQSMSKFSLKSQKSSFAHCLFALLFCDFDPNLATIPSAQRSNTHRNLWQAKAVPAIRANTFSRAPPPHSDRAPNWCQCLPILNRTRVEEHQLHPAKQTKHIKNNNKTDFVFILLLLTIERFLPPPIPFWKCS